MKTTFKHTSLIAAVLLACAGTSAMAQTKTDVFTGFGMGANLNSQRSTLGFSPTYSDDFGNTAATVDLIASYGFAMGQNWVGTTEFNYGVKNGTFATVMSGGTSSDATVKQHYSLSFAPGLRMGSDGLLYGKVSGHSMTANYTSSLGTDFNRNHVGVGLGIGYAMAVSKNVLLRAEVETVTYSSEQNNNSTYTISPRTTSAGLSLIYKF